MLEVYTGQPLNSSDVRSRLKCTECGTICRPATAEELTAVFGFVCPECGNSRTHMYLRHWAVQISTDSDLVIAIVSSIRYTAATAYCTHYCRHTNRRIRMEGTKTMKLKTMTAEKAYKELNSEYLRVRLQCVCEGNGNFRPIHDSDDYKCSKCGWILKPNITRQSQFLMSTAETVVTVLRELADTAGVSPAEYNRLPDYAQVFNKILSYTEPRDSARIIESVLLDEATKWGTMLGFDIHELSNGVL